jgi:hypothetical protein
MSRISVTIDRLILRGFERADSKAVAEGIRSELSRILTDPASRPTWVRSERTPILRLRTMGVEDGIASRRRFGAGVARAIAKGVKQ